MKKHLFDEEQFQLIHDTCKIEDLKDFITTSVISAVRENLEKVRPVFIEHNFSGGYKEGWNENTNVVHKRIDSLLTEIDEMGKEGKSRYERD